MSQDPMAVQARLRELIDDCEYFRRRADDEAQLAEQATTPEAKEQHATLAAAYIRKAEEAVASYPLGFDLCGEDV